eukprot:CAMPEP_0174253034 /NCGR_PEP_ID=MMETSP0439-20130205/2419_1 /TAXON_ID=0 /ORGANISM="Stereomyxa ramosa, Strain Chinc5" /LENGTH=377 /DNA_ID=CAMNT_0015333829 /DNA_START=27 /DNA_END=1160 /DNA_ORIENTATION=-
MIVGDYINWVWENGNEFVSFTWRDEDYLLLPLQTLKEALPDGLKVINAKTSRPLGPTTPVKLAFRNDNYVVEEPERESFDPETFPDGMSDVDFARELQQREMAKAGPQYKITDYTDKKEGKKKEDDNMNWLADLEKLEQQAIIEEQDSLFLALKLQAEEKKMIEKKKREEEESLSLALAVQMNEMKLAEERELREIMEEASRLLALELEKEEKDSYKKNVGPGYWNTPLGKAPFRRVSLSPYGKDAALYSFVQKKFAASGRTIKSIEYVQNEKLWKNYQREKNKGRQPEVNRFHGTPHTNVDSICAQGFLTSKDVSGRGTTIWSAENASVSVGYAAKGPAADGTHYMFLARVLSSMASISTVRNGHQMYPEYLIAFT